MTLEDFAIMASQWLTEGTPTPILNGMTWVSISDPGVSGHEGFVGDMSKYETTNAQYCQFLNTALASGDIIVHTDNVVYAVDDTSYSEPYFSTFTASSDSQITYSDGTFSVRTRDDHSMANHPVVMVSWYGATAFANFYGWRLPTEWEWQAVADYDGSYTYGCGTTIDQTMANYHIGSVGGFANPLGLTSMPYTSPVGYYPSYGYGMADMAGNVLEWNSTNRCDIPLCSYRVLRGGSWVYESNYCTVSTAFPHGPSSTRSSFFGFRVCR